MRRKNRRRMFTTQRYHFSVKPSTYGPGSYVFNATKLVKGSLATQVTLNGYYDILYENPELERIRGDFKYFKYLGITVTFYSRNLHDENNQTPCYFLVNYDGLPTENLRLQDNVKVVPAFHVKNKIFKFKIPTLLAGNGTLNAWVTSNELNNISQVLFQFHAPDNTTSWYFRIDIRMVCRGPTNVAEVKEIKTEDKLEEKDEIKEEENEEEKEIKQNTTNANSVLIKKLKNKIKQLKIRDSLSEGEILHKIIKKNRSENALTKENEKNKKIKEVKVIKNKSNQVQKDEKDKKDGSDDKNFGEWSDCDSSMSVIAEDQCNNLLPKVKLKPDDCENIKKGNQQ